MIWGKPQKGSVRRAFRNQGTEKLPILNLSSKAVKGKGFLEDQEVDLRI
jgi:hypothetical protein